MSPAPLLCRSAARYLWRGMAILFLIVFIDLVGFGLMFPLLPFYSEYFGASPLVVTLLLSTYSFAQFFMSPVWATWPATSAGGGTLWLAAFRRNSSDAQTIHQPRPAPSQISRSNRMTTITRLSVRDIRFPTSEQLDGSVTQRTLDTSLTDRLATFDWNGTAGLGIFEFALTRSRSYTYRPTLPSSR